MKHIKLFEEEALNEDRNAAVKLLDQMREDDMLSDKRILEFIIYNHLDGALSRGKTETINTLECYPTKQECIERIEELGLTYNP